MVGYLIGEEGPLAGLILKFEDGTEWVMGRDPDVVGLVLEDPMVSRKHVICRLTPEGYILENLSAVNPATQNGLIISEPVLLREGDIIQIGNTFFRFSEQLPKAEEESSPTLLEESSDLASLSMGSSPEARWMIKVITGPNAGAEFYMHKGKTYVLGKDPELCDIIFQDLSVSRQHARLTVDENDMVFIEDLGSRNGTLVGGKMITDRHPLVSEDQVSLGTTTFLLIDREQSRETVISEAPPVIEEKTAETVAAPKNWREMVIPRKHLIVAGFLAVAVLGLFVSMVSLFNSETVVVATKDESEHIGEVVAKYPGIQFSYNKGSGKLFLTGHVLTPVEKQELLYQIHGLPFITSIEDTVVIDEYVWENVNALLTTNPAWQGITVQSPAPGKFIIRGYLQTPEQAQALSDYLNMNFPYLDRLDNQVVIESNLTTQVQSMLMERGFNGVTYQLADGELVLSGRVDGKETHRFDSLIKEFKGLAGVRMLKNYVVYTNEDTSLVDITAKYKVMGYSKKDGASQFIVINGKILTLGDNLDGMVITSISSSAVLLEKDGLKFKINYNLQ